MASKEEGTCAPHSTCPKQLGIGHAGSQPACGLQWPRLEVWRLGSCQLQSRFVSPFKLDSTALATLWLRRSATCQTQKRHRDTATPRRGLGSISSPFSPAATFFRSAALSRTHATQFCSISFPRRPHQPTDRQTPQRLPSSPEALRLLSFLRPLPQPVCVRQLPSLPMS